jgi:hypothetical protein
MSGQIERQAGFYDLTGWTMGTVKVLSFAGRRSGGSPTYNVQCSVCQSQWVEQHYRLAEAQAAFRCRNTSCSKGLIAKPRHIEPIPEPKPEPIQTGLKVSPEYARYAAFVRATGGEPGSYQEFSQLDDVLKNHLMAPVEAQAYADALERNEQQRIKETYGIQQ